MKRFGKINGEQGTGGRAEAVSLGQVLDEYMSGTVAANYGRYGTVADTVAGLLGPELSRHAAVSDVDAGVLTVGVSSPSHLYELRLCGSELLRQLRSACPQAKIKQVKFVMESREGFSQGGSRQT